MPRKAERWPCARGAPTASTGDGPDNRQMDGHRGQIALGALLLDGFQGFGLGGQLVGFVDPDGLADVGAGVPSDQTTGAAL